MPSIWKKPVSLDALNAANAGNACAWIGLEFTELGDDYLSARLPVDHRTKQPFGLLHGGMSVVLAETLGSCAAIFACPEGYMAVGLDINANHLRAVTSGWIIGRATAVHIGRTTQVWAIDIRDEAGHAVCVSRITMAILPPRGA